MGQQKQRSGTPLETQGAARMAGRTAEDFFRFLGSGGTSGFDPRLALLGLGQGGFLSDATSRVLADPADRTAGLFAALQPFEERTVARETAGLREMFGSQGARLSSPLARAEVDLRSQIAQGFDLNRQQGLLEANAQQINALGQMLAAMGQANQQFFNLGQPGPAVFEPSKFQQGLGFVMDAAKIALPFFINPALGALNAGAQMQMGSFGGRGK